MSFLSSLGYCELINGGYRKNSTKSVSKKPAIWYRFVNDSFAIWLHEDDALAVFLKPLNGIHSLIQFLMEKESNGELHTLLIFSNMLRLAKDPQDTFSLSGAYIIPYAYGSIYVRTTKPSIKTGIWEYKRSC